jgi:hypothetical protein
MQLSVRSCSTLSFVPRMPDRATFSSMAGTSGLAFKSPKLDVSGATTARNFCSGQGRDWRLFSPPHFSALNVGVYEDTTWVAIFSRERPQLLSAVCRGTMLDNPLVAHQIRGSFPSALDNRYPRSCKTGRTAAFQSHFRILRSSAFLSWRSSLLPSVILSAP